MKHNIFEIAKWFTNKEKDMSHKKLQKLCWYAYSWYIALNYDIEEKNQFNYLFSSRVEAWVHGPVFPELYRDAKHCNSSELNKNDIKLCEEVEKFLNNVYEIYGNYSGDELESLTHQELPWLNARGHLGVFDICKNTINNGDIIKEYLPRN